MLNDKISPCSHGNLRINLKIWIAIRLIAIGITTTAQLISMSILSKTSICLDDTLIFTNLPECLMF